jgi:hypothetical protein
MELFTLLCFDFPMGVSSFIVKICSVNISELNINEKHDDNINDENNYDFSFFLENFSFIFEYYEWLFFVYWNLLKWKNDYGSGENGIKKKRKDIANNPDISKFSLNKEKRRKIFFTFDLIIDVLKYVEEKEEEREEEHHATLLTPPPFLYLFIYLFYLYFFMIFLKISWYSS